MLIVLYGEPKTGKSWFAGSTGPGPTLIFDTEAGGVEFLPGKTVTWFPSEKPPKLGDADRMVVPVQSPHEIIQCMGHVTRAGQDQPFRTIVLDSMSMLQRRLKKLIEVPTAKSGHPDTMRWWGMIGDATEHVADVFADAVLLPNVDCVVMICGATAADSGKMGLLLQGKARDTIGHQARLLAYLQAWTDPETSKMVRQLVTEPAPHCTAGNQLGGRIGGIIDDPNLMDLLVAVRPHMVPPAPPEESPAKENEDEQQPD